MDQLLESLAHADQLNPLDVEGILLIIANPKANAVVLRRFSNTLRDSVHQQIQWAIEVLGLEGASRCRVSPMEITYTPTGQRIVFRSADDPLKFEGR